VFPSELCAQKFLLRVIHREEQLDVEMLVAQAAIRSSRSLSIALFKNGPGRCSDPSRCRASRGL